MGLGFIFPEAIVFLLLELFLCYWVSHLVRPDTPSNPSHICSYKNLDKSKPTVETCWFNHVFDQLFCFASPSVSGCFHSSCKGILGDGNKDLYVKCGIWGGLERKINWVKCLDLISCWECFFFFFSLQLGGLFWRTEEVVVLRVSLVFPAACWKLEWSYS